MRKALVVGINYYEHMPELHGCVRDARAVMNVLERNSDRTVNFGVKRSGLRGIFGICSQVSARLRFSTLLGMATSRRPEVTLPLATPTQVMRAFRWEMS